MASGPRMAPSSEQPGLHVVVLDHRLHHERRLGQGLGVGHDCTCAGSTSASSRLRVFSTVARARSAESVDRASSSTGPWWAAVSGQAAGDRAAAGHREMFAHRGR